MSTAASVGAPPVCVGAPADAVGPPVVFDAVLLARIEDAGLNASAPPQQRVLGGWILRLSPGKAKRARCVNALAIGRLSLDELLARSEAAFAQAGLPLIVRITPFTQPPSLDATLAQRGFVAFDDTRVMLRQALGMLPAPRLPAGCAFETPGHGAFADAVGRLRGSPLAQRQAHAERLRGSPTRYSGVLLRRGGELLACGQYALEDDLVGLYDVNTAPAHRRQGLAREVCVHLLHAARERGARCAYLQVDADNVAARQLYKQLGFVDGYSYHYRAYDRFAG